MKKFVLAAVAALSLGVCCAEEYKNNPEPFGPIIPRNILAELLKKSYNYTDTSVTNLKTYVDQRDAVMLNNAQSFAITRANQAETNANAYTDSKITGGVGDISNRLVKVEGDLVAVSNQTVVAKVQADKGVTDAAQADSKAVAAQATATEALNKANNPPVTSVNNKTGAVTITSFEEFPASWKAVAENKTMEEFFAAVKATDPEPGRCFLGGLARMTPAPTPSLLTGNYEAVIKVPVKGVYIIEVTSTNNSPYYWFAMWDTSFYGWRQIMNAEAPSAAGTYTLKCVVGNTGVIMMQWVKDGE